MKKIVFTLQVFGLMATLPLYIMLEFNHVSAKLPQTEKPSAVTEIQEKPVSMVLTDTTVAFESDYLVFNKH